MTAAPGEPGQQPFGGGCHPPPAAFAEAHRQARLAGLGHMRACLPQSELRDLIAELRSLALGVGSFARQFDTWRN